MKQTDKLIAWRRTIAHMHGRRKAEEFLGFLAASGKLLGSEISFYESLPKLASIMVPFLGDWVSIDLFFGDGWVKNVAEKSCREMNEEQTQQLRQTFRPYTQLGLEGTPEVVLAKKSTFYSLDPQQIQKPEDAILTALGVSSYMVIPLELPLGRIGAIAILSLQNKKQEESRQYGPTELALGEELGRRISLAIERSILYNEGWRLTREITANNNTNNN